MNPGLLYRETAIAGASPIRLVVLLYEQAIEDLRRAVAAQRKGDIEERTREINHAVLVIGHLQATLDRKQGGKVSDNLERFYRQVISGLREAQAKQSTAGLEKQISLLIEIHDAWCEVERQLAPATIQLQETGEDHSRSEWNA